MTRIDARSGKVRYINFALLAAPMEDALCAGLRGSDARGVEQGRKNAFGKERKSTGKIVCQPRNPVPDPLRVER